MKFNEYSNYLMEERKMRELYLLYAASSDSEGRKRYLGEKSSYCLSDYYKNKREMTNLEKTSLRSILNDQDKLSFCLDNYVRNIIIGLLRLIGTFPTLSQAGNFFERVGMFDDTSLCLDEFSSLEDVRKYLFEEVGLEYVAATDLRAALNDAILRKDDLEIERAKANYIKAGIGYEDEEYTCFEYTIEEIDSMPKDLVKLLSNSVIVLLKIYVR